MFSKADRKAAAKHFADAARDDHNLSEGLEEAAYSAKAGRAGKDLGKPGKMFSKIAAKSGGGEKGERIAGAILKKIRAKHMKEDQGF
jgi:hypothetical protein